MERHPSFQILKEILEKYPKHAGSIFMTYNDLSLSQKWRDLEIVDLIFCKRGAFRGKRPGSDATLSVVPCSMSDSLSLGWLDNAYNDLGNTSELYLAISTDDSSIVYYKISKGLVKPPL